MTTFKKFNPKAMAKNEAYNLLTSAVIPRPIAYVTSQGEENSLNGAPFSYFNIISAKPPLLALSVGLREGKPKDTTANILKHKEFVVHMVDRDNLDQVNQCSKAYKANESEVDVVGFTVLKSDKVETRSIQESPVRFECRLFKTVVLGDGGETLIIGEIVQMHVNEKYLDNHEINAERYKPIARLGKKNYAKLGEVFSLERPK